MIKPDPAIYDHHAASFALEPAATLFIDDSQKNVDGARAAGWQAVLFESADQLTRELRARGLSDLAATDCNPQRNCWRYGPARSMPSRAMRRSSSIGVSPPLRS